MKRCVLLGLLCLLAIMCQALEFSGFVDYYTAAQYGSQQQFNANRSRLRAEMASDFDAAWFFCSANAVHNSIMPDQSEVALHEAYVEYVASRWDLRIGRQIVTWGKADGLRLTDILCPMDLRESITQDFDDLRLPQSMVKFRFLPGWADLEIILIPRFQAAMLPAVNSPWARQFTLPAGVTLQDARLPASRLKNGETAAKISCYRGAFDAALSASYTWEDTPLYRLNDSTLCPVYKRRTTVGGEISTTMGDVVVRAEVTVSPQRWWQSDEFQLYRDAGYEALVGADWNPGSNWNLSGQIYGNSHGQGASRLEEARRMQYTCRVSKTLLRETLELSQNLWYQPDAEDFYWHLEIDYAVTDALHLAGGGDVFGGDGSYGVYTDNSQLWCRVRYSY